MRLCPLSVTFHFSAVWAFTPEQTGHIYPLALKVSEAEEHVLVSDISVHLRDHLCPLGYCPRWSHLHCLAREEGS